MAEKIGHEFCEAPGCPEPAPFGFSPPGWKDRFWMCAEHQDFAEYHRAPDTTGLQGCFVDEDEILK